MNNYYISFHRALLFGERLDCIFCPQLYFCHSTFNLHSILFIPPNRLLGYWFPESPRTQGSFCPWQCTTWSFCKFWPIYHLVLKVPFYENWWFIFFLLQFLLHCFISILYAALSPSDINSISSLILIYLSLVFQYQLLFSLSLIDSTYIFIHSAIKVLVTIIKVLLLLFSDKYVPCYHDYLNMYKHRIRADKKIIYCL